MSYWIGWLWGRTVRAFTLGKRDGEQASSDAVRRWKAQP